VVKHQRSVGDFRRHRLTALPTFTGGKTGDGSTIRRRTSCNMRFQCVHRRDGRTTSVSEPRICLQHDDVDFSRRQDKVGRSTRSLWTGKTCGLGRPSRELLAVAGTGSGLLFQRRPSIIIYARSCRHRKVHLADASSFATIGGRHNYSINGRQYIAIPRRRRRGWNSVQHDAEADMTGGTTPSRVRLAQ